MCTVLQVSRSGFYAWHNRVPSQRTERQQQLVQEIRRVHVGLQDYGSPRVHRELVARQVQCSKNTVAKLMQQNEIAARTRRKFRVVTTDSDHVLPIAPNILEQNFTVKTVNQVWLTDFTYIPTAEGFLYLCTVLDLCSRRIVGWAVSDRIDAALALAALQQAIDLRRPASGLIVHSDRGSQFASLEYQQRLAHHGFRQSMSRRGNCYDNAPMESFFRSFKVEHVYWHDAATREEAARGVLEYIERFYNRTRRHSSLDYCSPVDWEAKLAAGAENRDHQPL